jgi:DNA-binding NarL/FixJ family response regulator
MAKHTKRLRILVADDHDLVRRGIRGLLRTQRGWSIVAEAATGREAIQMAKKSRPDLAILDVDMPDLDGLEATRQILEASGDTTVLILTLHGSDLLLRRALEMGARGYVLKSDLPDQLIKAIRTVSRGKQFLAPKATDVMVHAFLRGDVERKASGRLQERPTPRELEILRLLAVGKSNKEIAAELGITVRTAETHRAKIMQKLGFHSLAELIHYAFRQGIVSPSGEC